MTIYYNFSKHTTKKTPQILMASKKSFSIHDNIHNHHINQVTANSGSLRVFNPTCGLKYKLNKFKNFESS